MKIEEKDFWNLATLWAWTLIFRLKWNFNIKNTLETLDIEGIRDPHVKWEFLKYEIRKFSIEFSKLQAQNAKKNVFRKEAQKTTE